MPQSSQNVAKYFQAERVVDDIAAIYDHTRWCTSRGISRAAAEIVRRLRAGGVEDVELIKLPANGKTFFGGWVMSKAWDATSATLTVASPETAKTFLADFGDNPHSLMMWSPPTPADGVEGPLVLVSDAFAHRGALSGKFVLVDHLPQIAVDIVAHLAARGAAAVLSDHIVEWPGVKEGKYLDRASQYHNYAVSPWDGPRRIPGFSLRREDGRRLRQLLAQGPVRLRANVKSRLYDGTMPLISASLPGRSGKEIVLTGHMDEPGASDNASGAAVAMEILRALAAHVKKTRQPLEHTVRILLSVELRGIQGYLNIHKPAAHVLAGLDLDQVGYDHRAGRTALHLVTAQPNAPSYLEVLLADLAAREAKRPPLFRWDQRRGVVTNDCHWAAPPWEAKMAVLGQHFNRTYHTNLDTPQVISSGHLRRMGRLLLEATAFLARSDYQEIRGLAQRIYQRAKTDLRKRPQEALGVRTRAQRQWQDLEQLLPPGSEPIAPDQLIKVRHSGQLLDGVLYSRFALQDAIRHWDRQLAASAPGRAVHAKSTAAPMEPAPILRQAPARIHHDLRNLVPVKQFVGYLGWEDLSPFQRRNLLPTTGITPSWGAPDWLQYAVDLATGKRSLEEIAQQLDRDQVEFDPGELVNVFKFLRRHGKVSFQNIVEGREILAAVRRVGIRAGDIVVAHAALSDFGYVRGGADAMIDALLQAVGPRGTLAMPTHSTSWLGKLPYDPASSPSRTGAVAGALLCRPKAVRSLHPTHSVTAIGPAAAALVAGHDHRCAPQGRQGFWGHFADRDGKILMLCSLGANTFFHAIDLWAGAPHPPVVAHYLRHGRRVEYVQEALPWHTCSFPHIYAAMFRKRMIRSAPLGRGKIHSMRAQDALAVGLPIVRRNPALATEPDCDCWYCTYVRRQLAQSGRRSVSK